MFRRYRGGPGVRRQVALVVLPVIIGASILLFSGDRSASVTSVLETTDASTPASVPEPALALGAPLTPEAAPPTQPVVPGGPLEPAPTSASTTPSSTIVAAAGTAQSTVVTGGAAPSAPDAVPSTTSESPATTAPAPVTTAPTTTTTTAPTTTTTVATGPVRSPSPAAEVVPATNADRVAEGLEPLARNGCLDSAASRFAEQMAHSGVLAHNPGAGAAITDCRPGATWGDNVGTAAPCDVALLEQKWMASAGHRRNILTPAFRLIGVGAWTDDKGGCWVQVLFSS
jgi:uncharacterized protein YkwD